MDGLIKRLEGISGGMISAADAEVHPLRRQMQLQNAKAIGRAATALAEARAEIDRLHDQVGDWIVRADEAHARAERMKERIKVALFGLRGHEVLEPNRFHNGNRNDLIAVALWDLCRAAVAALTDKPET